MVVVKVFSTCKTIFKVDMKSQILPDVFVFDVFITMSGDVLMCFYVPEESVVDTPRILQYLDTFLSRLYLKSQ